MSKHPTFDPVKYITGLVSDAEEGLTEYSEVRESIRAVLNPKTITDTEKEKLVKLKDRLKERKTTKSIASTIDSILTDIGKVVAGVDSKTPLYIIRAAETEEEKEDIKTLRELFEREIYGEISHKSFYDGTGAIEWEIRGAFDEKNKPAAAIWYAIINVEETQSKYFYIEEIFSHPDHREEGLASKLILDMLEREYGFVQNGEIGEVVLHSVETAVVFYIKRGFFVASEPVKKGEIELTKMVLPLTRYGLDECIGSSEEPYFGAIDIIAEQLPEKTAQNYTKGIKAMLAHDQNPYPFETNPLLIPLRDRVLNKKPL